MSEEAAGASAPESGDAPEAPQTASANLSTPEPAPTAAPSPDPADPNAPWYASIENEELRGVVESRKWDSIEKVVESYRNLEKLRGVPEDRLMKLPSDLNDPEWRAELAAKLGRPETPDGYEGVKESWLKEAAHKAGLDPSQVRAIREAMVSDQTGSLEAQTQEFTRQAQVEMDQLKYEWGQNYQQKELDAKRFAQEAGLTADELQEIEFTVGTKRMMNLFSKFGAMLDEGAAPPGGVSEQGVRDMGRMSREAAVAAYQRLNGDPEFQKRLFSKDNHVRKAAMEERAKLSRLAFD